MPLATCGDSHLTGCFMMWPLMAHRNSAGTADAALSPAPTPRLGVAVVSPDPAPAPAPAPAPPPAALPAAGLVVAVLLAAVLAAVLSLLVAVALLRLCLRLCFLRRRLEVAEAGIRSASVASATTGPPLRVLVSDGKSARLVCESAATEVGKLTAGRLV